MACRYQKLGGCKGSKTKAICRHLCWLYFSITVLYLFSIFFCVRMLQSTHIAPSHRRLPQITWKDVLSPLLLTVLCIGTNFWRNVFQSCCCSFQGAGYVKTSPSLFALSAIQASKDLRDLSSHPPPRCGDQKCHEKRRVKKDVGICRFFFGWKTWGELGAGFKYT